MGTPGVELILTQQYDWSLINAILGTDLPIIYIRSVNHPRRERIKEPIRRSLCSRNMRLKADFTILGIIMFHYIYHRIMAGSY